MNITPKQYATGLLRALHGTQDAEAAAIINAFVALLAKNNDAAKTHAIIAAFSSLWDKAHGVVESEIVTAKKMDAHTRDAVKTLVHALSGARTVNMSETIDAGILGGAIIRYDDMVLDYSVQTKINDLISAIKK